MKTTVLVICLCLATLALIACAPPAAEPSATPEPPTATPVPPTPEPPTATPVPPTPEVLATVTPIPPKPTPTEPTPTLAPEAKSKIVHETFTSASLEGNLLGTSAERSISVYLPPSYDRSDVRYPVIYSLPFWGSGNATDFGIPDSLDRWVQAGQMPEAIIVEVDMSSRENVGDYYRNNQVIGNWEDYIAKDMVTYIDSSYRTLPKAESRVILGLEDAGGGGAVHVGLKYPGVFGLVGTMAPGLGAEPFLKNCILAAYSGKGNYLWAPSWACKQLGKALALSFAADSDTKPFAPDVAAKIDGEWQLVPEVWEKIEQIDPSYDIEVFKNQPDKLRGFLWVHSATDQATPIENVRTWVKAMTDAGIPVDFREVTTADEWGHHFWDNDILMEFLSKNLVSE